MSEPWRYVMDIGVPRRVIVVEPEVVPNEHPEPEPAPVAPNPEQVPEPVPAGSDR